MSPIDVAVVGANFGAAFAPIYLAHPDVGRVGLVDTDTALLNRVADALGVADRFDTLETLLRSGGYGAVHIATPVRFHVEHTVATLHSGRHVACAVPMATDLDGIERVLEAQRDSGRSYMMMETMVYGREFLYAAGLHARGDFGELTYLRGTHLQDLDGYPEYWHGYPPLMYSTHALSPLLALADTRAETVVARGSGQLTAERRGRYDNPFPIETGLFGLAGADVVAEVTVNFFQVARTYQEGFSVYGTERSLEWAQSTNEDPLAQFELEPVRADARGRHGEMRLVHAPDRPDLLPEPLARFTRPLEWDPGDGRAPVAMHAEHAGAHPYLVDEFVSSIVQGRRPAVDAVTAATWTAPGIAGHASAMRDGAQVAIPDFGAPASLAARLAVGAQAG